MNAHEVPIGIDQLASINDRSRRALIGHLAALAGLAGLSARRVLGATAGSEAGEQDRKSETTAVALVALRLYALPQVKQAMHEVKEQYFRVREAAQSADGSGKLDQAVEEMAFAAMLAIAGGDAMNPRMTCYETLPYVAAGAQIPGARNGFDNGDRVYRHFFINPAYQYELSGRRPQRSAPVNMLLEACEAKPPGWGYPLSFLRLADIDTAADGSFVISADGTAADGRRSHLYLPPSSAHVLIRETLLDWSKELPAALTVRRVSGPEAAPRSFAELAKAAPDEVVQFARNQFLWYDKAVAPVTKNAIATPQIRPAPPGEKPWGMTAPGKYQLADDEALVFTLEPQTARYLGILVATPWMVSIDYSRHTSSLNSLQTWPNPDGTLSYVVAARDPGLHNWLDCGDNHDGTILIRWEMLDQTPDPSTAVRQVTLTKINRVAATLPFPMPRVTPPQRRRQVDQRHQQYLQRLRVLL